MAYQIIYPWDKEAQWTQSKRHKLRMPILMLAVAAVTMITLWIPSTNPVIRQLLHPLLDPFTAEAFGDMVRQVGSGTPVVEALVSFCTDILMHAG